MESEPQTKPPPHNPLRLLAPPHTPESFLDALEKAVAKIGVAPSEWDKFIGALESEGPELNPWLGKMTAGKFMLESWKREFRVPQERVERVAEGLAKVLELSSGVRDIEVGIRWQ